MRQRKRHGPRLAYLAQRIVVRLVSAVLDRLPTRTAVEIRELLQPLGRLDYPRAELRLRLDSIAACRRTGACRKEPETVEWIETFLEPGEVFYDIGANVGAYSLVALAATEGRSRVVAFEPGFETFAALCANIQLNGFESRVIPLQLALADETRLETFHYSQTSAGAALHRLGREGKEIEAELRQTVPAFRLDELVEALGLPRPNHLKVDVDGPELAVLRGAGALLADPGLRSLLVEVDEDMDPEGQISRHLVGHGFQALSRHPRGPSGKLFNVCFVRDGRRAPAGPRR